MKKTENKSFTLIELLVVIAIIAKNQTAQRHPDMYVRILSKVRQ